MLESVLSGVTSPVASGLFGENSVFRHFPLFDATPNTNIRYETPFVSDGNLEVEFNFYVTEVGTGNGFFAMYSDDASEYMSLKLNNNGTDYQIKMQSDGVSPGQGTTNLADGQSHKANFRLSANGTIEIFVDDVLTYESTHADINRVIGTEYQVVIGCLINAKGNDTFSRLNGYMWDFKMWIGGHKETGTLWIDDPLGKPVYDVYYPSTYKQEPNLFASLDAPYTPEDVATYIVSGGSTSLTSVDGEIDIYRVNANSSWLIRKQHAFDKGAYIVDIEFDMTEEWSLQNIGSYVYSHRESSAWVTTKSGDSGKLRYVFVNDADGHSLSVVITSNTNPDDIGKRLRIKKFNIRPLTTSPASAFNFIDSDYTEMTLNNGRWETENLIENGAFNNDSTGWTFADGWSVVNGKAKRDGDSANDGIEQVGVFNIGRTYQLDVTVSERTVGNILAYIGQGTQLLGLNSTLNDAQTTIITSNNGQSKLLLNGTNNFDGAVDNVSVKEILNQPTLPKSRSFTKFDNVAQTAMVFDTPISLGLNWKIKVHFCVDNLNSLRTIVGNGDSGSQDMFGLRVDVEGDGARIRAILPRSQQSLASRAWPHDNAGAMEIGVMHCAELSCANGTDFTFIVDGEIATVTFNDIDTGLTLNRIGSMAAAVTHFNGYIADLQVEVDGVPVVDMPIDGAYQEDRASLVTNTLSEFVEVDFIDDIYTINEGVLGQLLVDGNNLELIRDSNDGGQFGWNYTSLDDSKEYVMEFDIEVISGIALAQYWTSTWGGRGYSQFYAGDKFKVREKLHNIGKIRWKLEQVGNPGHVKFNNVRIYEITGNPSARADNFLIEDTDTFTYWKKGKYLGQELVTQDVWENPSYADPAWSFDDNKWMLNGDGSYQDLALKAAHQQPNFMLLSGELESLSGSGLQVVESNAGALYVLNEPSNYSLEINKSAVTRQVFKRQVGATVATITKPSLREILEYKQ